LNFRDRAEELQFPLEHTAPKVVMAGSRYVPLLEELRSLVYGGRPPSSPALAVWHLALWVEERLTYDYAKESIRNAGVYDPVTLVRLGRGVCADYAVLESLALASANMTAMMALYPAANHATAAVAFGGAVIVLDQHPPPVELQDYLEYLDPRDDIISIYLLDPNASSIAGFKVHRNEIPDLYPEDRVPMWTMEEAMSIAVERLGMEANPDLSTVIKAGLGSRLHMRLETLTGRGWVGIGRLYTPLLDEEWAKALAEHIEHIVSEQYGSCRGRGSLWALLEQDGNDTILAVYAVPISGFHTYYEIRDGRLIVEVSYAGAVNTTDVSLLIYREGSTEPCAGVVPRGYMYPSIPYVEASEWKKHDGRIVIVVGVDEIEGLTEYCRPCRMLVWLKGYPIYSIVPPGCG
jgi:hypothetical protein